MTRRVRFSEARGAAAWASYFINGDSSGLEPREVELADAWAAVHGLPVDVDSEPSFSWAFGDVTGWAAFGIHGGDLVTYTVPVDAADDWLAPCDTCKGDGGFGARGTCDDCEGSGTNADPRHPDEKRNY